MSSEFNAYSSWLGIPEDEQPPHYYRLLGLEPFESDPDVIRQAGQRVINMVKSREKGSLGTAARRLKAEVTFAASCLLDEKKKAQYDRELDAWFNDYDAGDSHGDDYELEEPDLPLAKIVQRGGERSTAKSKAGGKVKSGSSVRTVSVKSGSGKSKSSKTAKTDTKSKSKSKSALTPAMIGGLAVAVVAVLGLAGGLAYVFLKPEPVAVANVEEKPAAPAFDPDEEDEEAASRANPSVEAAADPDEEAEDANKTVDSASGAVADPVSIAGDTTVPVVGDPAGASANPATATTTAANDPSATPGQSATPDTTAAAVPESAPAEANPKSSAPPATEVATTEPAPDPKLEDPFRELGTALELPVYVDAQTSTTPVVLAKVYPKEGDRVNVKLLAGEAVLAKLGEFSLSGGSLTDPEPKWTVKFVDRQGRATPVANLEFKNNELSFAWTGEGVAEKNNVLCNCLLKISAGYTNRNLPMRKPIEIEPLSVVMEAKGTELQIPLVGLPEDRDTVILEITKLVGGFPADATYDPGQQVKTGESFAIMFGKLDLAFKGIFAEDRGSGLKLDVRPMLRGPKPRNNGPRPLKPYAIKPPLDQQIANTQGLLNVGTANYETFKKANAGKKEVLEQAEIQFQQGTNNLNEQIKRLNELKTAIDTIAAEGKVQFRVFMRVGDYSVEIVKTKDYSPPEPEKKEPAKK